MSVPRSDGWSQTITTTWVHVAKITHPLLDDSIRVSVDSADVTYGGEVYAKGSMGLVPPDFTESEQVARVRVANINRGLGLAIQRLVTPAEITIALVNAADPDTNAVEWPPLRLANAVGNSVEVSAEFRSRVSPQDRWPKESANKETAPGLFV